MFVPPNAFEVFKQKEDLIINDPNYEHVRVVLEDPRVIRIGNIFHTHWHPPGCKTIIGEENQY
eukprot:4265433-Prorocentrum_lima.AAC.1